MRKCLAVLALIVMMSPVFARETWMQKMARFNPFVFDDEVVSADDVPVDIISDPSSPLRISSADVKDKGTSLLKMKGLEHAFTTKLYNNSGKKVLAYQLVWERHLPFEEYAEQDIRVNSLNTVRPGASDDLEFRKPIHYRKDAFYKVFVAKVLFEDETEWKSSRDFDVGGYWADIKKEIDAIDDSSSGKSSILKELSKQKTSPAQ